MVNSFDHVHLYSANPDAAMEFWCGVLGAEKIGMIGNNTLLILGGQFLAVSAYPPGIAPADAPAHGDGALMAGFGVAHLGLNVSDIDALLPALEAAGAKLHGEPRGEPPIRFVYFTAPDGVVVELTQYVLPAKLAPAGFALRGFNRAVHAAKRAIGRALVGAAAS